MAELRDQLVLDIDSALRSVDELGDSINRTLSQVRDVQIDDSSFRTVDERLSSIEQSTSETASEISELELAAGRSAANFERLARELDVSEDEARRLSQEILEGANSARRLESEAQDVARQLGLSETEARQFVNELSKGPREVQQIDERVGRLNQGLSRFRTLVIGAVAAFGVRGIVRQADQAIDSFNSLNESVNAVNVTFGEGAETIFQFGERAASSAGLARGAFQQAVVPVGALLQNFGFDARESADAAVELTQRAADLASVFNTDVNDALNAIGSALRGETEPIRQYGVDVSQAAVAAQALSTGLVDNVSDLEGATLAQGRLNEILRQTERVAGDFAATAEDPANAARILAAEAENARAAIGESLIPAYLAILEVTPAVIESFEGIGPALETLSGAVVANADEIGDAVVGVIDTFARLGAAAQILGIQVQTLPTQLLGIATSVPILGELFDIFVDLEDVTAANEERAGQLAEAYAQLDLITSIQEGIDPLSALVGALQQVENTGGDVGDVFEDLARIAGFSGTELIPIIRGIINEADRFGLSASDIEAFRTQLFILRNEAGNTDGPFFRPEDIIFGLNVVTEEVDDGIISFQELRAAAEEAGVGLSEAFGSDLFPEGTDFSALARIEAQVEGFRDRINAIGPTIDPLEGAAEAIKISVEEFENNIRAQFEQGVAFETALTELGDRGFEALAATLRGLGPGAVGLVEDFLNDAARAEVSEDILDSSANLFADQAEESYRKALFEKVNLADILAEGLTGGQIESLGLSQTEVDDLTRDLVNTPAASESGAEIAENLGEGFNDYVSQNAAGISLQAVEDLAAGLTDSAALQEAIDAGRLLAVAASESWAENLTFDFTVPTPTPQLDSSSFNRSNLTDPDLSVGGVTVNQTVNTTPEREQTDVARSTQLAGSVARNIR